MPACWFCVFRLFLCFRPVAWLLICAATGGWPATAQAQAQASLPFHFERPRQKRARLPFEFQRNLIIVQASLNGKGPFNFLLDTGVSISLITDPNLVAPLKLRRGEMYRVAGVGEEGALEAFMSDSVRVEMPGIVAPALSFLVLSADVLNLSGYVGMPVHGLLGYDVFRSFAVEIEPGATSLLLHTPDSYRPPKGRRWTSVPLEIEARKPYIRVPVSLSDSLLLPLKLVLDTGAGHALSIETGSDPRLSLPPNRLRAQLGQGLSGTINGYIGRVQSMQLGRYRLNRLLTSFPDADNGAQRAEVPRNGNVGLELLKRFDMVVDYAHNQLWLKPNGLFRDPFEHDMCGMELLATGREYRRYIVLKIQPNSPASTAGLTPGDELMSINLMPVSSFSLTEISRIFHSEDGRVLFLLFQRPDGELYPARIKLKRQI